MGSARRDDPALLPSLSWRTGRSVTIADGQGGKFLTGRVVPVGLVKETGRLCDSSTLMTAPATSGGNVSAQRTRRCLAETGGCAVIEASVSLVVGLI